MTAKPLPRVLFLSNEPPQLGGAGSIVFHRLFEAYPPDRLFVITNASLERAENRLNCRSAHLSLIADRLNRTRLWPWRAVLRTMGGSRLIRLQRVRAMLRGFVADVVVTLMQDGWIYDLAARFAKANGLPLVLFVHDLPDGFEPVPAWLRAGQLRRDARVYRQASVRIGVSAGMAAHFASAFGYACEVMHPPRSAATPAQSPAQCSALKRAGRLTLGFAGGLHYGYGEQMMRMLPVLRATDTVIEVFGAIPQGVVAPLRDAADVIRINGRTETPEAAWRRVLERCDAVLQPYLNPPGPHLRQYRTHFPSKLGDCLALGLPLLVIGPEEASGVAWCLERPSTAFVVTDPSPVALRAAFEQLRDAPELRIRLAAAAQENARYFNVELARHAMYAALQAAIS